MPTAAPYSAPSPWMSMEDLMQIFGQSQDNQPNASFDPSVQANLNNQTATANQAPEAPPALPPPGGSPGGSGSSVKPADMSGLNKLLAGIDANNLTGVQNQKDVIERLKAYRDSMPQGAAGMNFQPLMALADAWGTNKSNLAGNYKIPETAEERAAKQASITEAIGKASGTLTNDELQTLRDKLTGEVAKIHYGQEKGQQKQDQDDKTLASLQSTMLKDKNYVAATGITNQADEARSMVQAALANPQAKNDAAIAMARLMTGGQRLNIPEIDAQGGSKAVMDHIAQIWQSAGSGTLTPENAKYMQDVIDLMAKSAAGTQQKTEMDFANKVRARTNYDLPTAYNRLSGKDFVQTTAAKPSAPAAASASSAFKAGDVREKDGVKYQRDASGQWRPM